MSANIWEDGLDELAGRNAKHICLADLSSDNKNRELILNAAELMCEHQMISWIYVAQREDGATIWRNPDDSAIATVTEDGDINITHF